MRTILTPDSQQNLATFKRLYSHQTVNLISECSILLSFNEWLPYVQALFFDKEWQAIALIALFREKLEIRSFQDLQLALAAVQQCKSDKIFECSEVDYKLFTKVQFSLQKGFCTRNFNQEEGSAVEAVAMLEQIDGEW